MAPLYWVVAAAILARLLAQLALAALNAAEVRRHAGAVPAAFRATVDEAAYARSAEYTLAKNRFGRWESAWEAAVLAAVLFSGVLPVAWQAWTAALGASAIPAAGHLVAVMLALSLPALPLEWWAQFRLEQRFGFNRGTLRLWIVDKLKGAALGIALGLPLLALLLALVDWIGPWWWLAGWAVFLAVQLLMIVLYPMLILPWFNKLTPLPEGAVRTRLLALADRARFHASTIQVMDGSKRSGHSNAFFTGFGRFRRIVLFDTLLAQLEPAELEAVLAHEIGHYKLGHIPRMLAFSAALMLGGFALVGWLAHQPGFFAAFGFAAPDVSIAFLLFALLGGLAGFWFGPVGHFLSRRHEYQADDFARRAMGGPAALVAALRKLSRENLANLTPHPLFSAFYYSHPTLLEREEALRRAG